MTFLFNGGPGSGSVWLQMGAFGPKRVAIPSDARDDGAPPYPMVDNPDSLLDVTDLVFIDPPGTGFSYLIGKTDPKEFYGVTRCQGRRAGHPPLAQRQWPLGQPEVSRRRKLWHDPVRRGGQRA